MGARGWVRGRGRHAALLTLVGLFGLVASMASTGVARAAGDTGVRDASAGNTSAQTEQTIAVDPTNPSNVLTGYISGLSVSHDGGLTWKQAPVSCGGDNNPTFDRAGVAYFECDNNGVEFYRSNDKGDTWSAALSAVGFFDNNGDVVDRPWFVPGLGNRSLVVGWESFFTNPVGAAYLRVSNDGGTVWGPTRRVDDPNDHPALQDPRQLPVVGADGTIYVVYASGRGPFLDCRNCAGVAPTDYIVARSSDNGATFHRTVAAANISRTAAPTEESEAISSLAADPNPARAKRLALAWADQRTGESRILVATSLDGGATWSNPADVPDDPPGKAIEHDHPQIAFGPDGRLIVVWRDRRCCGTGWTTSYQLFTRPLTITDHGDLIGGAVTQVTDQPEAPNSSSSADEYLGLSVGPEGVSVAWNQPRKGAASTTFRRIPLAVVGTAPASGPKLKGPGPSVNRPASAAPPASSDPDRPVTDASATSSSPSSRPPFSRAGGSLAKGTKDTNRSKVRVDGITMYGVIALSFMMIMYALERRHRRYLLLFAVGCVLSSGYGFASGAWPFGVVELIWAGVAVTRYRDIGETAES